MAVSLSGVATAMPVRLLAGAEKSSKGCRNCKAGYPDKCGDFDEKNKLLLNYNKLQHAFNMYHFQRNKKIMNFTFFINTLSA
ncbi:MAG: hypothetical protein Q8P42_09840 [Gallionella sp.]|nr:hypothetical protein [Gallionella sp.]